MGASSFAFWMRCAMRKLFPNGALSFAFHIHEFTIIEIFLKMRASAWTKRSAFKFAFNPLSNQRSSSHRPQRTEKKYCISIHFRDKSPTGSILDRGFVGCAMCIRVAEAEREKGSVTVGEKRARWRQLHPLKWTSNESVLQREA